MDQIPPQALIPIGAVCAALIAGFFSYLNLIISKEQKISEFRQAWIDKLREDISKYFAAISFRAAAYRVWDDENPTTRGTLLDLHNKLEGSFSAASQAYMSIVLRINPNEPRKKLKDLNTEFLTTLETVKKAMRDNRYDDARLRADDLAAKVQPILKAEWKRVKSGELIYRITVYIAAAILLFGVVGAGAALRYKKQSPPKQIETPNQTIQPTAGSVPPHYR